MIKSEIHETICHSFKTMNSRFEKAVDMYEKHKQDISISREEAIILFDMGIDARSCNRSNNGKKTK